MTITDIIDLDDTDYGVYQPTTDRYSHIALPQLASPGDDAWRKLSLCLVYDLDFFDNRKRAEAKAICAECSVTEECLDYALRNGEGSGVWGGLEAAERKALIKSRASK